jgi:hypothetical protein
MLVYRVANGERTYRGFPAGPYCSRTEEWEEDMAFSHNDPRHPSPDLEEDLRGVARAEFCGFESMAHLNAWFEGWLHHLDSAGYLVHVYEVPDDRVRFGIHQVVAQLEEGRLLETIPCI